MNCAPHLLSYHKNLYTLPDNPGTYVKCGCCFIPNRILLEKEKAGRLQWRGSAFLPVKIGTLSWWKRQGVNRPSAAVSLKVVIGLWKR